MFSVIIRIIAERGNYVERDIKLAVGTKSEPAG
jgi:hypothetical protein